MDGKPIECRALVVMRETRGLKKHALAALLGMKPDTYYEYEIFRVPDRALLEQAAAALSFRPHFVDVTLAYLRRADQEAALGLASGPDAAADLELVRFAEALGSESTAYHLAMFQRSRRLARAVAEREAARVHFPRLRAHPAAERPAIVRETPVFQTWAMSELAAHESIEAAAGDPDEALAWADLAVLIAELAPGDDAFLARSVGYAVFHHGNANRAKGRLHPEAEADFDRAKALWAAGEPGDPERLLDEARVLGLEASFKRAQGELPGALDLIDRALEVDRGSERKYLLINRATVLEKAGDFEEALLTLRRALPLVNAEHEPYLAWGARFNALVNTCQLGWHAAAAEEYEEMRKTAAQLGGGVRLARMGWLAGWIKAGLGQPAEAEAAFERVRREFLQRDMPVDAALATLELAVLYKKQGRAAEVQKLAGELKPIFDSQKASREALATLVLFREAVEQGTLTLELAQRLLDDLRRNRSLESRGAE